MKYIQTLPDPTESTTENIGEGFHYEKFTQYKTSCTLKIDLFEIPDNKKLEKFFPK